MKLIYRCGNCEGRKEVEIPLSIARQHNGEEVLAGEVPGFTIRHWIRHPCCDDVHGIAPLIAIVDD